MDTNNNNNNQTTTTTTTVSRKRRRCDAVQAPTSSSTPATTTTTSTSSTSTTTTTTPEISAEKTQVDAAATLAAVEAVNATAAQQKATLTTKYLARVGGVFGAQNLFSNTNTAIERLTSTYKDLVSAAKTPEGGKFGNWEFNIAVRQVLQYALAWSSESQHQVILSKVMELTAPLGDKLGFDFQTPEVRAQWLHAQIALRLETTTHNNCCPVCCTLSLPEKDMARLLRTLSIYISMNLREGGFYHYMQNFLVARYSALIPRIVNALLASFELEADTSMISSDADGSVKHPTAHKSTKVSQKQKPKNKKYLLPKPQPQQQQQPATGTPTNKVVEDAKLKKCLDNSSRPFMGINSALSTVVSADMMDSFSLGF